MENDKSSSVSLNIIGGIGSAINLLCKAWNNCIWAFRKYCSSREHFQSKIEEKMDRDQELDAVHLQLRSNSNTVEKGCNNEIAVAEEKHHKHSAKVQLVPELRVNSLEVTISDCDFEDEFNLLIPFRIA